MQLNHRQRKRQDKAFITRIIFIFILIPAYFTCIYYNDSGYYFLLADNPDFRFIMGHSRHKFHLPNMEDFISGNFQKSLEEAAQDNLPFIMKLLPIYRNIYYSSHNLFLHTLPHGMAPAQSAGRKILMDEQRMYNLPLPYHSQTTASLRDRANYYNNLATIYPHVSFNVIPVLSKGDWLTMSPNYFAGRTNIFTGDRYVTLFRDLLSARVGYTYAGEGRAPEFMTELYYRTDHHFNIRGTYNLYCQLYGLLNLSPTTPLRKPLRWFQIRGVEFRGSTARQAIGMDNFADKLEDGDFQLPPMETTIHDQDIMRNQRHKYEQGTPPTERYVNHYARYFGNDRGIVHYKCPSAPDKRLLVISDSYDNAMEPLIASHFLHAYFIDLRLYKQSVGVLFDFDTFIPEYGITDVLFLGEQSWTIGLVEQVVR